ncbi:MAG TPA: hypothetical protein DCQ32_06405 [Cyanobacteria bacterium UBA8156]|jgi:hypothetical protein|nr:hypothetical protein [Cyanobacteria bacterium UBA8156]
MTPRTIVLTGADALYFPLVSDTIASIRDKPEGQLLDLGFLDLGCTEEQLTWVRSQGGHVVVPGWDVDFPNRAQVPDHYRGMVARPFFRQYFPGYDLYLWIDADAWVQDWSAVDLFLRGAAQKQGLAIVPEINGPSDRFCFTGKLPRQLLLTGAYYQESFGMAEGQRSFAYPLLNAGVFCLHREAPHWDIWRQRLQAAEKVALLTDQMALNLAVYHHADVFSRTEFLPGWCNFLLFEGCPVWDENQACFVEKYLPHHLIGIIHIAGPKKYTHLVVPTLDGQEIEVSVRYAGHRRSALPFGEKV